MHITLQSNFNSCHCRAKAKPAKKDLNWFHTGHKPTAIDESPPLERRAE